MTGRPGRPRTDPAAMQRRWDKIVEYYNAGYTYDKIGEALGLAPSTVGKDCTMPLVRGRLVPGRRPHPDGDPPAYDWRTPPPAIIPPEYQRSGPMMRLEATLQALRDTNAANRFAFNIDAVRRAGDRETYTRWQVTLHDLHDYLGRLIAIIDDDDAAQVARTAEGRDDLEGLTPGRGQLPTRVHAAVWQYAFAGIPLDEEAIEAIARGQNTALGRVRYAIADLRGAGVL